MEMQSIHRFVYIAEHLPNHGGNDMDAVMSPDRSMIYKVKHMVMTVLSNYSTEEIYSMGHQLDDMIIDCSFGAKPCDTRLGDIFQNIITF